MTDWLATLTAWDPEWLKHLVQYGLTGVAIGTFGTLWFIPPHTSPR